MILKEKIMDIRVCDNGNLEKFDQYLDMVKKYKIGIELQTFAEPHLKNEKKLLNMQKVATAKIKHKSMHAPFWDLNLGTALPELRNLTMKYLQHAYKVAKELGCDAIVFHNGYVPFTSKRKNWIKRAAIFWQDFFADKDDSITIMIENMLCLDSSIILEEIDAVHDKRLKVCLDIGHAHGNSDMPVYDWIKTLNKRIGYMHMHNNHGKISTVSNDEHKGFFDGTIDMKKIMRLVQKHCPKAIMAIETGFNDAEEAILFLKKYAK